MNRLKILIYVILISITISSCQVFPYVIDPATETPTGTPVLTATPQPTHTMVLPTAPPEYTLTEEPTIEPSSQPDKSFTIHKDGPFYMPNFAQPSAGCQWMGVAGQVFDEQNHEIQGLVIVIGNTQAEDNKEWIANTGTALAYGPGGFEIQLTDEPIETSQKYWIEVRSQDGTALSERFFFNTYDDCDRNLVLINFVPQ